MTEWPFGNLQPLSYDMLVVDPPWRFAVRSEKGITSKGAGGQYSCMSMDEIAALPIKSLAKKDCMLWLWATNPMIDQQIDILKAWGFKFKTLGFWNKITKNGKQAFGTGYIFRCSSEPVLIGTIGNPKTSRSIRSSFNGVIREHSRKPDEAYAIAEAMMPKAIRRADLFTRQSRPGWDAWGDEATKFDEENV